jgi:5-methylthioadenosine/S-adenosylhomocysteine deaminase
MPGAPSDTHIKARWLAPMTAERLLEHQTLVMLDGRIIDILPHAAAQERYAPRVVLERPTHVLMPGLVNARTSLAGAAPDSHFEPEAGLASIANLLRSGTTCVSDVGYFPNEAARLALSQGLRAAIGVPVAAHPSAWAHDPGEYLSRGLRLRDEYKGHPAITTFFAPIRPAQIDDATFERLSTLVNELDATLLIALHESPAEIGESMSRHGRKPLERLEHLGLLTPALTATHGLALATEDLELAQCAGIGIVLCLSSGLLRGAGLPARPALGFSRLGLGSDAATFGAGQDLWSEIRLFALQRAGDALAALTAATLGGARVLGLDAEIGTLERGKSADLCCLDLGGPATQPLSDPLHQLVFLGGRDLVSDVWVAGRQLLSGGQFTRLDWPKVAERLRPGAPLILGETR